jgi:hypothetical protein
MHSHDLGAETFLVLEGQIEFHVESEHVVCQPGQLIYVPPRTKHAVRAIGSEPGAIYLSVTPHVEPTHTFYDEHGSCLSPRYGVWREAGGGQARPEASAAELRGVYRGAAARLAELAAANLRAIDAGDASAETKEGLDALWTSLYPLLHQVRELESAWNELAGR